MCDLPDYVLELLAKIADADNLSDYTIELNAGSKHGDNFLGVIHRAILRGRRHGKPAELNLILKLSTTNESRRKEFQMDSVFKREVLAYHELLPLFEKFQRDKGLSDDEGFFAFPKCLAAVADAQSNQFAIIMEDLKVNKFVMLPKEKPIAGDHIYLIVEQLAKMHAISFAIKDQQPQVYDRLRKVHDLFRSFFTSDALRHLIESPVDRAIDVLENEDHIEWLKDFRANLHDEISRCFADGASEPFGVIGHGDFWLNNILFRYDEEQVSSGFISNQTAWIIIRNIFPCRLCRMCASWIGN